MIRKAAPVICEENREQTVNVKLQKWTRSTNYATIRYINSFIDSSADGSPAEQRAVARNSFENTIKI